MCSHRLSYTFWNEAGKKFSGLYVFDLDNDEEPGQVLKHIFREQTLLQKRYKKVLVCYCFPESALLPEKFYEGSRESLLNMLYGDLEEGIILTDVITGENKHNIYRVPFAIHNAVTAQFPLAIFTHQYSNLVKKLSSEKDILYVIFYPGKFIISLMKDGLLQIIQTYDYRSAVDMVYYMLTICKQFDTKIIPLRVAGIINENDELLSELNRHFSQISFDTLQADMSLSGDIKELPAHYFSPLFYSVSCV